MSFLFDTHIHTKESSACGEVRAADIVARYKSLGYDGIIVTDHMQKKGIDRSSIPNCMKKMIQVGAYKITIYVVYIYVY